MSYGLSDARLGPTVAHTVRLSALNADSEAHGLEPSFDGSNFKLNKNLKLTEIKPPAVSHIGPRSVQSTPEQRAKTCRDTRELAPERVQRPQWRLRVQKARAGQVASESPSRCELRLVALPALSCKRSGTMATRGQPTVTCSLPVGLHDAAANWCRATLALQWYYSIRRESKMSLVKSRTRKQPVPAGPSLKVGL